MRRLTFIISIISLFLPVYLYASFSPNKMDNWLDVLMNSEKIGYLHTWEETTVWNKQKSVLIRSQVVSKLMRFGIEFEVMQDMGVVLNKQGSPVFSYYNESLMGSQRTIQTRNLGNQLEVLTILGNATTSSVKPWSDDGEFESSVMYKIMKKGLKSGWSKSFDIYSPELNKSFHMLLSVSDKTTIHVNGTAWNVYPVRSEYSGADELSGLSYITPEGVLIKCVVGSYGIEMIKTTPQKAEEFSQKVDIADLSGVKIDRPLKEPQKLKKLVLKVIPVSDKNIQTLFPTDDRQKWKDKDKGLLILQNSLSVSSIQSMYPIQNLPSAMSIYTSSSPYVEASHPDVMLTAQLAIGTVENSWEAVTTLNEWVHNHIQKKGFDTGFGTALETLRSRKGDCTEHAVLFAGLSRSLGIPTRLVVGLAAVESGYFYHMWDEVYLDGHWIPIDPTFNQIQIDAAHIKLAVSDTGEDQLGDFALNLMKSLNKFRFEVVETSY